MSAPGIVRGGSGGMGAVRALAQAVSLAFAVARGTLFPWVPVLIATGVGLWFALPADPGPVILTLAAALAVLGASAGLRGGDLVQPLGIAALCMAAGFLAAEARARAVDTPRIDFRYYGPVQGRVVLIDRSQSDQPRLTLDRVVLDDVAPARTPARVRVSLHGGAGNYLDPVPGQVVMLTGHLAAPEGPVEPGGFDFRRMAFFDGLGAVGYTRAPVLLWAEPSGAEAAVNRLRAHIRAGVEARIPGDPGAFAAALVTGDRAGISPEALQALRDSNLAHLLAISGLHMGLLAAIVFGAVRYGLALVPPVALRVNGKKAAAVVALLAGGFYLILSGGNVATERAYVMVAVMLVAVLADRRALSLRSVAIAASVLLLWQPETLAEPGFQMSFAATVALIAGFAALGQRRMRGLLPGWAMPVAMVVFTSAVAGFATAPYAAAHFNRLPEYGLLANTLSVPLMGTVVMPAAVAAAVLAPLGLEAAPLWVMEQGTAWILGVAAWVAGMEGAVTAVPAPPALVLPLFTLGALWVILWPGWGRVLGAVPVCAAFAVWATADRPAVLISGDGALVGMMTAQGRALSADRGAGFAARQWIENDGDTATQEAAAVRPGFSGPPGARRFRIGDWKAVHLKGRGAIAGLADACTNADLVVIAARVAQAPGGCQVIDQGLLRRTGAVALWPEADGALRLEPSRGGARRWMPGRGEGARRLARPDQ